MGFTSDNPGNLRFVLGKESALQEVPREAGPEMIWVLLFLWLIYIAALIDAGAI
jgi:hypothetical protein